MVALIEASTMVPDCMLLKVLLLILSLVFAYKFPDADISVMCVTPATVNHYSFYIAVWPGRYSLRRLVMLVTPANLKYTPEMEFPVRD